MAFTIRKDAQNFKQAVKNVKLALKNDRATKETNYSQSLENFSENFQPQYSALVSFLKKHNIDIERCLKQIDQNGIDAFIEEYDLYTDEKTANALEKIHYMRQGDEATRLQIFRGMSESQTADKSGTFTENILTEAETKIMQEFGNDLVTAIAHETNISTSKVHGKHTDKAQRKALADIGKALEAS